mgnify:CR=1 FL=1
MGIMPCNSMILLQQTFKTKRHARKFHHAAKGRSQGGHCRSIRDNGGEESAKEIKEKGAKTVADALRGVSGVVVR